MRYFTADTHFGHKKAPAWRGYGGVDEMDAEMIFAWNQVVGGGDLVIHLGDFAFANKARVEDLLSKLHGEKDLGRGNHDPRSTVNAVGWAGWFERRVITLANGARAELVHNPADATGRTGLVLHGHMHGMPDLHPFERKPGVRYYDVGVDARKDMAPIREWDLIEKLNRR